MHYFMGRIFPENTVSPVFQEKTQPLIHLQTSTSKSSLLWFFAPQQLEVTFHQPSLAMAKTPGDVELPAATLKANARVRAEREREEFRFTIKLLAMMSWSIFIAFRAYSRFETWETTKTGQKVVLITGVLSALGMPFAILNTNVHPCVPRRTLSRDESIVLESQIFS
ncbi:hypothetical protein G7Y89_g15808 [Cudoniella acicularis]|uniref:Uncharacterized protein n=1 Tax=Cudoniella acicularis TaxID=354080 RepID=A0A8H4QEW0_9HELO|nr:hypothetical protein G7Y89_g15808 [Cudoniella acicularis]